MINVRFLKKKFKKNPGNMKGLLRERQSRSIQGEDRCRR